MSKQTHVAGTLYTSGHKPGIYYIGTHLWGCVFCPPRKRVRPLIWNKWVAVFNALFTIVSCICLRQNGSNDNMELSFPLGCRSCSTPQSLKFIFLMIYFGFTSPINLWEICLHWPSSHIDNIKLLSTEASRFLNSFY